MGDRQATEREEGFDLETGGLTLGLDYRLTNHFVLGGALGYLNMETDLADKGGAVDAEGYSLSLYSTWFSGGFYADGILSWGGNDFDAIRIVKLIQPIDGQRQLVARGAPSSDELSFSLALGYDAAVGATTVAGFGRLSSLDADIDGYTEQGAQPFNLVVEEQEVKSLLAEAGVELAYAASYSWGVVQPQLRLSVLHEFKDDSRLIRGRFANDADANGFAVPTDDPDRDFFNLGVGLSFTFKRGRAAYIFYDTDLERDDLEIYTISAGFRLEL